MNLTLSDTLGSAATGSDSTALGANPEATAPEGPSFGQLMNNLLPAQPAQAGLNLDATVNTPAVLEGQLLAASPVVAPETLTAAPGFLLKEINLGPNLNLITSETAAPDPQSLEAFARAQGLDEKAVSWLFGKTANAAAPVNPNSPTLPNALTGPAQLAALNANQLGANPNANPVAPQAAAPAQAVALQTAAQVLGALVGGTTAGPKAAAPSSNASNAEDGVPVNLLRMPPPATVWMQRNLMNSALANNAAAQKGPDISESELNLGADWDPDTLNSLLGKDSGSATATGSSTTGTHSSAYANFAARWDAQATARADLGQANGAATAEPSSAAARSENIQNLAEKMGQAVGQRMLSEMEKGQWHLKLQLRPATLGHIEVEMRMRSGEFDAVFTAPNPITRDLLQDGMAKLKETLAQMGMDVASVYVGNGQTGQSGGDSTPRSPHNTALSAGASAKENDSESNHRAPLVKTPKEGLDVLV